MPGASAPRPMRRSSACARPGQRLPPGRKRPDWSLRPLGTLVQMSPLPALRTPSAPTRSRPLQPDAAETAASSLATPNTPKED